MFLGRNSIFSKLYLWNMAKDLGHIIAHIEPKSKSCLKNMHRVKKAFEECWLWFTSKACRVLRHHLRKWLYFWSGSIFIILRGGFLVKIPDLSQSLDTSILELRDFLQLWIQQTILIWFERSDSYVERSVFEYLCTLMLRSSAAVTYHGRWQTRHFSSVASTWSFFCIFETFVSVTANAK